MYCLRSTTFIIENEIDDQTHSHFYVGTSSGGLREIFYDTHSLSACQWLDQKFIGKRIALKNFLLQLAFPTDVIFNWTEQEIATLSKCFCATTQDDSDRNNESTRRINNSWTKFKKD